MTKNKKQTHGGPRPGAGRPSSGRKPYTIRLHPKIFDAAKELADETDRSVSDVIELSILKSTLTIKRENVG